MKHQQITVDFISMVFTACSYLALAGAVWIFLRLLQACFWLPRHLKRQNQVQQILQDKVENYEQYILECERKEQTEQEMQGDVTLTDLTQTEKWKERRECLEMLKKELSRVRDGGVDDPYEWDCLLEEEETENKGLNSKEIQDDASFDDKHDDKWNADPNMMKQMAGPKNKKDN